MSALGRVFLGASLLALLGTAGCRTESYCFANCDSNGALGGGGGPSTDGGIGPILHTDGGPIFNLPDTGVGGGNSGCQSTESCNGVDDDCDGLIDDGIDFKDPLQCGNCATNCRVLLANVLQTSITCVPPADDQLGKAAGQCQFSDCAPDYWDHDPAQPGCETYCIGNPTRDPAKIDKGDEGGGKCGQDDDCDGETDEDLALCTDSNNCGACGAKCIILHGTGRCVSTAGVNEACISQPGPGQVKNTGCEVATCDAGWWDADGASENGCEYQCTKTNPSTEVCDTKDNDCDNLIDNEDLDLETGDPAIGKACHGSVFGECATTAHAGVQKCISGAVTCCDESSDDIASTDPDLPSTGARNGVCDGTPGQPAVLNPGDEPEICDDKDNDCDGETDEGAKDVGGTCGKSVGACSLGVMQCNAGAKECVGDVKEAAETCNGVDDDCDGVTDGTADVPTAACTSAADCPAGEDCLAMAGTTGLVCAKRAGGDVGKACSTPPSAPCVNATGQEVACTTSGATPVPQPCNGGTFGCVSGVLLCQGALGAKRLTDECGKDSNCDGRLDGQPDLQSDVANCGTCAHDCRTQGAHVSWQCVQGQCQKAATKCQAGYIDCDANADDCERQCTPSGAEQCNGFDDDCDCQADDPQGMAVPTPVQVCGVDPAATDAACTTGVTVACQAAKWKCTFQTGICTGGNCSTAGDKCDGIDNNCNGIADEAFRFPFRATRALTQTCYSDEGLLPPGHGACRGAGTYECKSDGTDTYCPATLDATKKGTETCNGQDDDCDGYVDERFSATGSADGNFVKPDVIAITGGKYIYRYEASRPNASTTTAGSGNGYHTSAPAGTTLDKTLACSAQGKIPWFNVTPTEAQQACTERGGQVCTLADWQTACRTSAATPCKWGYNTGCTAVANYTSGPFCNLHSFDFDPSTPGVLDDGLLTTGSALLNGCNAKWGTSGVSDITGNLREITQNGTGFTLMGGGYDTVSEDGASCDFKFFSVSSSFRLYDTGFRCCFSTNPS